MRCLHGWPRYIDFRAGWNGSEWHTFHFEVGNPSQVRARVQMGRVRVSVFLSLSSLTACAQPTPRPTSRMQVLLSDVARFLAAPGNEQEVIVLEVSVAWCGVAWRGLAWRGVAWRGVAWRGVAWFGVPGAAPAQPLLGVLLHHLLDPPPRPTPSTRPTVSR